MWKLALAGVVTLWVVIWLLNAPATPRKSRNGHCGLPSPDDRYGCVEPLAHVGWCRNGQLLWRGSAWAAGAEDDTCFAAEPEVVTEHITGPPAKHRRLPRTFIWLGVFVVMFVWNYQFDTEHPPPPRMEPHCDQMEPGIYKCVKWSYRQVDK